MLFCRDTVPTGVIPTDAISLNIRQKNFFPKENIAFSVGKF